MAGRCGYDAHLTGRPLREVEDAADAVGLRGNSSKLKTPFSQAQSQRFDGGRISESLKMSGFLITLALSTIGGRER